MADHISLIGERAPLRIAALSAASVVDAQSVPRYYFQVDGAGEHPDMEGSELPDIYAAQAEAAWLLGGLLRDAGASFWDSADWRLSVTDEAGTTLFVLRIMAEEMVGRTLDQP